MSIVDQSKPRRGARKVQPLRCVAHDRPDGAASRARFVANAMSGAPGKRRGAATGIHPATSEMDYTADECEFLRAIERYQRATGRQFPTWSEALAILRSLGYRKGSGA